MAFPAGVITRQVNFGPFYDSAGDFVSGQMQIQSSTSLEWTATDELILAAPISVALVNGFGSVVLPVIQTGFVVQDAEGNQFAVSTWTYQFTPLLQPNMPRVPAAVVELGAGDGTPFTIDFYAEINSNGVVVTGVGPAGPPGDPGAPGAAPVLEIGSVVGGSTASATLVPQPDGSYQLNLVLPTGPAGSPGSVVGFPIGGTAGQIAVKVDGTDYNVAWANLYELPTGGTTGQYLVKSSSADGAANWADFPTIHNPPAAGSTGQVLEKNSGTDYDFSWSTIHQVIAGGTTGQALVKVDGTDYNLAWATVGSGTGLPNGGTVGQLLKKNSSTNGDASWFDAIATAASGSRICVDKASGTWPARPTVRTDIVIDWRGVDPSPPAATTPGTTTDGMYPGDERTVITS